MSIIKVSNLKCVRNYKIMVEKYNSAMEVVSDCKTRKRTSTSFKDTPEEVKDNPSWYGVKSYEEALELLQDGYQPTVDKMKTALNAKTKGDTKRIKFENSVVGYQPIVPLAIMNIPNSMIDMRMKPIKAKVIDVYYNMTASAMTDSKDIMDAGCKLLGAIISLEKEGYKFNLYTVQNYADSEDCDLLAVKIKDSNQPIDLKRMSFSMSHTAFFRCIGFDWYSKSPKARHRRAYGHALFHESKCKGKELEIFKELFGSNAVYIGCTDIIRSKDSEETLKEYFKNEGSKKAR